MATRAVDGWYLRLGRALAIHVRGHVQRGQSAQGSERADAAHADADAAAPDSHSRRYGIACADEHGDSDKLMSRATYHICSIHRIICGGLWNNRARNIRPPNAAGKKSNHNHITPGLSPNSGSG